METRNMKVGEIYRYKHRPGYIVEIVEIYEYRLIYKYLVPTYDFDENYDKTRWDEDFEIVTKLHTLLEGLDES
jgi:hypothetical protein